MTPRFGAASVLVRSSLPRFALLFAFARVVAACESDSVASSACDASAGSGCESPITSGDGGDDDTTLEPDAGESDSEDASTGEPNDGQLEPDAAERMDASGADSGEQDAGGDSGPPINNGDAAIDDAAAADSGSGDSAIPSTDDGSYFCGGPAPTASILLSPGFPRGVTSGDYLLGGWPHWELWQLSTRRQLSRGEANVNNCTGCPGGAASIAGDKFLVSQDDSHLEVRAISDSHVIGTITYAGVARGDDRSLLPALSVDGSYVWQRSPLALTAWSVTGQQLFQRSGNYMAGRVFAAADGLRVAHGPAGANVIERVTLAGDSTTTPAFVGAFQAWFDDGGRFITTDGAALRVYSRDAASQHFGQITAPSLLFGFGDLVSFSNAVYRVGNTQPITTFSTTEGVAVWNTDSGGARAYAAARDSSTMTTGLLTVDLRGSAPEIRTYPISAYSSPGFSAASGGFVMSVGSLVYWTPGHGTPPRQLGCGDVEDVAGSDTGRAAVATQDGLIRLFSFASATPQFDGAIVAQASQISMSRDGTRLLSVEGDTLRLYALPERTQIKSWKLYIQDPNASEPHVTAWSFSPGSRRLGYVLCPHDVSAGCSVKIEDFDGNAVGQPIVLSASSVEPSVLRLSPNARRVALGLNGTSIYEDGVFVGGSGLTLGDWVGDDALVLNSFVGEHNDYAGTTVTNVHGEPQRSFSLSAAPNVRAIDATQFYDSRTDRIYSVQDGHVIWEGGRGGYPYHADLAGRYRVVSALDVEIATWR